MKKEKKGFFSSLLDGVSLALDVAGFIPGIGTIADIANAGISLARGGRLYGAAMNLVGGAVPIVGDAAKTAYKAKKAAKVQRQRVKRQRLRIRQLMPQKQLKG